MKNFVLFKMVNMKKTRQCKNPEINFWSKVLIIPEHTCWEWIACKQEGYGRFSVNKRLTLAHRFSYELHYGPIPKGLLVCHKCDNPGCVKPDHLFLGTHHDNLIDSLNKGRQPKPRGEGHPKARLSNKKAEEMRESYKKQKVSFDKLGKKFGVSRPTAYRIIKNISYVPKNSDQ